MTNLPTLYQNIMLGLPSEFAREVFLWASDKTSADRHLYKAEAFAREADQLRRRLGEVLDAQQWLAFRSGGLLLTEAQAESLADFVMTRHANWRMGGNVRPAYCGGAA